MENQDGYNKKPTQTVVEWYYQQTVIEGKTNYAELLEQAKQMEREQIEYAFLMGQKDIASIVHKYTPIDNTMKEIKIAESNPDENENGQKYYSDTYGG